MSTDWLTSLKLISFVEVFPLFSFQGSDCQTGSCFIKDCVWRWVRTSSHLAVETSTPDDNCRRKGGMSTRNTIRRKVSTRSKFRWKRNAVKHPANGIVESERIRPRINRIGSCNAKRKSDGSRLFRMTQHFFNHFQIWPYYKFAYLKNMSHRQQNCRAL